MHTPDPPKPTGIQRAAHRGLETLAARICSQIGRRVPKERPPVEGREPWDYRDLKAKMPRFLRGRLERAGTELDDEPRPVESDDEPDVLDGWWIVPEDEPPKPGRPVMPGGWWIEIPFEENRCGANARAAGGRGPCAMCHGAGRSHWCGRSTNALLMLAIKKTAAHSVRLSASDRSENESALFSPGSHRTGDPGFAPALGAFIPTRATCAMAASQ
jgi:hypothetical protein